MVVNGPSIKLSIKALLLGILRSIGSRALLDSHDSMLPPKKRGENLGSRNSWCSESSQAIFRWWWWFSCEVWVFQKEQPEVALAPSWCFQGRFSWNTFWSQELEVKWWNQFDEPDSSNLWGKTTKYRSHERDVSGAFFSYQPILPGRQFFPFQVCCCKFMWQKHSGKLT